MAIVIDESRPGIIFTAYPLTHTLEEWVAHTDDMIAMLKRTERFVMISDTTGGAPPTPAERRMIADSFEKYESYWRARCYGASVVVESALVRGAITALQWLKPPPFATHTASTRDEAFKWAEKRLKEGKPG